MQATARLKYLMMSPRKLRRVVSLIKGKSVDEALTILKFTHKAAAGPLAKTIQSATANALAIEGTSRLKAEDLSIATIMIDEGPRAKRVRFRAMGRVYRYKKPFAHITVVVEGTAREQAARKKTVTAKTDKAAEAAAPEVKKTKQASTAAPKGRAKSAITSAKKAIKKVTKKTAKPAATKTKKTAASDAAEPTE